MTPVRGNHCGHCGAQGHYRPRCPSYEPLRHERVTRPVREAMERATRAVANEVVTDPRGWGMW